MSPDNAGYYHAAYVIAVLAYTLYALSIWWRARRVRARMARRTSAPGARRSALEGGAAESGTSTAERRR
jgi:hypothetical protein